MKIWLLQINLHLYVERFAFVVGIGGGEIKYTVNFSVTQGNLEGKLEVWSEGIYYFWSEVSLLSHRMSSLSCVHAAQNPPPPLSLPSASLLPGGKSRSRNQHSGYCGSHYNGWNKVRKSLSHLLEQYS